MNSGPLRTYRHLHALRRVPQEYDVLSARLLYWPERGFEVKVPLAEWYRVHLRECGLTVADWDQFRDPETRTYARYVEQQNKKEIFVDALLEAMARPEYQELLTSKWQATLERSLAPLRFVSHGFQMVAAYLGQLAPSGRLAILWSFQAADELRRVQRLAQRMALLRRRWPAFGEQSRALWLEDPAWQPVRQALEFLLVTFNFGEALVALGTVLKPLLDQVAGHGLGRWAREQNDYLLAEILESLRTDTAGHHLQCLALIRFLEAAHPDNAALLGDWHAKWVSLSVGALAGLDDLYDAGASSILDRLSGQFAATLAPTEGEP